MANANTSGAIARITQEIASTHKSADLSIAVACRDSDVRLVRALIIGPPETPYEFGFFEFDMKFPRDYPIKPPSVGCITTNNGKCRFNPNIYAEGKVCLSILGTWHGDPGEEWSSAQGLESVLLSIQSLMSSNPYENEPGHEDCNKEQREPKAYIAKIRHETLRISVLKRLEAMLDIVPEKSKALSAKPMQSIKKIFSHKSSSASTSPVSQSSGSASSDEDAPTADVPTADAPHKYNADADLNASELAEWDPFADLMKRRFLWHYDAYMQAIESFCGQQRDGTAFISTEFEYPSNCMQGHFDYQGLKRRMSVVREKLEEESRGWVSAGVTDVAEGTQLATQLAFQFKQLRDKWSEAPSSGSRMEISLVDPGNPFEWHLCIFGEPMTNLDGGVFNLKMQISPGFPEIQPRVTFETPIFHHRVSSNGTLCYFPEKHEEIDSHLHAIISAIDDRAPIFDPRAMVNPDAFALFWGGDEKRKVYNRKLRRSAQESTELL